jgi:hypothetical protein
VFLHRSLNNRGAFHNKKKQKKQRPRRVSKGAPKRRPKNGGKKQGVNNTLLHAARMVADPCNASLDSMVLGTDGYTMKRYTRILTLGTDMTSGYLAYAPEFACQALTLGPDAANIPHNHYLSTLFFAGSSAAARPAATGSYAGMFYQGSFADITGISATQGGNLIAPGEAVFANQSVSEARCVGACITVQYTGRADSRKGQIRIIDNIPVTSFVGPGDTAGAIPYREAPSIAEVLGASPPNSNNSFV